MTWPMYSPSCRKAVADLLKRGGSLSAYRANPQVGVEPVKDSYAWRFEREAEKRFKVKHAVAVNSGTAALHCALAGLNLRGQEVITSPYSFSATVSAIVLAGGTPVFADVDPYTFCITPETVKHVITKRTRAILPVHLFGQLADVRGLKAFGLPVVEDACQSVGARNADGFSGTQGLAGGASCNGGKNIPAGEFGFLTTNDGAVAEKARYLMNHGENFNQPAVGYNYRPTEVQACIAYHGLLELEERNRRRQEMAADFYHAIRYYDDEPRTVRKDHAYYVTPFTVHKYDRKYMMREIKKAGLKISAGYITPPLYFYPAFKKYFNWKGPQLYTVNELSESSLYLVGDLTPDKPKGYGKEVGMKLRKILYGKYGPV